MQGPFGTDKRENVRNRIPNEALGPAWLPPIAAVEYLEAARPLARNDQLGMTVTKLYLSNWPASGINLPQDDGCAPLSAPRRPALASITAPTDLNGCRLRIEVGLEHSYQLWRGPTNARKKYGLARHGRQPEAE